MAIVKKPLPKVEHGKDVNSKNAVIGQLFECRFNFSGITFSITKVYDVITFCNVDTGEEHNQNKAAFDQSNFISKNPI